MSTTTIVNVYTDADTKAEAVVVNTGTAWLSVGGVTLFVPSTYGAGPDANRVTGLEFVAKLEAAVAELRKGLEAARS